MLVYEATYALRDGFNRAVPINIKVGTVEQPQVVGGKTHWIQLEDCPDTCKVGFSHINGYEDYARQAFGFFHAMLNIGGTSAREVDNPSQVVWLDQAGDLVALSWAYTLHKGWQVQAIGFAYCRPSKHQEITGLPKPPEDE